MSQNRLFEFEAPDSTFDINSRFVSIAPQGLYAGFDVVLGNSMNLELNHDATGRTFVNQDLSDSNQSAVVITKQGVEIRIDNTVTLPISVTTVATRRDAIILTHSHQAVSGGVAATISVLQDIGTGTPSLANDQVLLGTLQLPSNCTALNQSGVSYDRANFPEFGNGSEIQALKDSVKAVDNEVQTLQSDLNTKIPLAQKGVANGVATLGSDSKIPLNQLPEEFNKTKVVANIAERDTLIVWEGRKVHVSDASADTTVGSGSAGYIWNGTAWEKVYEGESLDLSISLNWQNLTFIHTGTDTLTDLEQNIQYSKDVYGYVRFKGRLRYSEAIGNPQPFEATLPVGFRPTAYDNAPITSVSAVYPFLYTTNAQGKSFILRLNPSTGIISLTGNQIDSGIALCLVDLSYLSYYAEN